MPRGEEKLLRGDGGVSFALFFGGTFFFFFLTFNSSLPTFLTFPSAIGDDSLLTLRRNGAVERAFERDVAEKEIRKCM